MHIKNLLLCVFLGTLTSIHASVGVFLPPENWKPCDPKHLLKHVQAGFVGSSKHSFQPSINFAIEAIQIDSKEYVKIVKKWHLSDSSVSLRDLGTIDTNAGKAHLLEITKTMNLDSIKLLQCILVKNSNAYVLTAAILQKEFLTYHKQLMQSFASFRIEEDLFSCIKDLQKKQQLLALCNKINNAPASQKHLLWKNFQKTILQDYHQMGLYWQMLILKQLYPDK